MVAKSCGGRNTVRTEREGMMVARVSGRCMAMALLGACCMATVYAQERTVRVCVQDQSGLAIRDARIRVTGSTVSALSDGSGCASVTTASGAQVQVTHEGFADVTQAVGAAELAIVMRAAESREVVNVT